MVGAGLTRDALLLVARHDRDRMRAKALGDLESRGADAAGGAVDEHGLALLEATAGLQREVGGVVVEDERRALREVELVGQLEAEECRRHRDLRPAAEHAERGDAVAGLDLCALRRLADHPADLAARRERKLGLDLVLAAGLEQLGERHAGGVDVDDHALAGGRGVVGLGLGDVDQLQRRFGAGELDDLDGLHWWRTLAEVVAVARGGRALPGRDCAAGDGAGSRLRRRVAIPGGSRLRRRGRRRGGNGNAATARSASLPRLTGLPPFHPEDAERSEAHTRMGHISTLAPTPEVNADSGTNVGHNSSLAERAASNARL